MQAQLLNLPPGRRRQLALGALVVVGAGGLVALYSAATAGRQRHTAEGGREGGALVAGGGREMGRRAGEGEDGADGAVGEGGRGGGGKKKRKSKKGGGMQAVGHVVRLLVTKMGEKGAQRIATLAALAVLRTVLSNRLARVQGFLFRAAFLRRVPLFARLISENLLLCVAHSAILSSSKFLTASLALQWRSILTTALHEVYFQGLTYYRLSHVDKRVDSVEQRLVSDVPQVCQELADLTLDLFVALCDSAFYTVSLCSYTSPKYALGILGYVLGAGAVTTLVAPPFGKLLGKEQEKEGEYRQLHARVRTHCESIAFYRGHALESSLLMKSFRSLLRHASGVLHTQWWFGIVQDFLLKYCGATWAVVLIIGPFFGSELLRPGGAARGPSSEARAHLLSNMRYHTSVVIALFQAMGTLAGSSRRVIRLSGYAERIWELMSVARELGKDAPGAAAAQQALLAGRPGPSRGAPPLALPSTSSGGGGGKSAAGYSSISEVSDGALVPLGSLESVGSEAGEFREAKYIEFQDVTVVTPTGNKLVEGLTLRVDPGNNLLITGPNGSGKSSLFRVLGGLWPLRRGRIWKPGRANEELSHDIFYVPQRPYMAIGTLLEQLIYPLTPADLPEPLTEERIRDMLSIVNLEELVDRYGIEEEVNWGERLSLGQQQRLGMARLFYHAPTFAILDECTSAVTTDMEERFAERVKAMGTTCVTISHRPALVAFHDTVLALDGEGGWTVHHKRDLSAKDPGAKQLSGGTERKADANVNTKHFMAAAAAASAQEHEGGRAAQQAREGEEDYKAVVLATSPEITAAGRAAIPRVPRLQPRQRSLPGRILALSRVLMPRVVSWQGFQLASLGFLVLARTGLSDRIANLNGTSVRNVLQQDRVAFNRLILVSLAQSLASAIIAPTLRHIASSLALGWRARLTQHLTRLYFRCNAYYKVAALAGDAIGDADQRMCDDVSRLCSDVAGLVSSLVKPSVDILWFTWRMSCLTGRRGVIILYAYMLLGLGFLRAITPDFSALTQEQQQLEGAFRFMHNRLRTHAESVAFFGGGDREHVVIASRFLRVLAHQRQMLQKRWLFGIADEFITKQLPHNVTWGLSLLYALDNPMEENAASQGELAHTLRFLASVVSHSFLAFGDILELYRKVQELSGTIARVMQLDEALIAAQQDLNVAGIRAGAEEDGPGDEVGFRNVDVVTPAQKLLAFKLTVSVLPGQSLLVTGPNGSGKSSLFRVLGGLWPLVSGTIIKPAMPVASAPSLTPSGPHQHSPFPPSLLPHEQPTGRIGAHPNGHTGGTLPRSETLEGSLAGALNGTVRGGGASVGGGFSNSSVNLQGATGLMFYVPQRPYAPLGTLRDQLIYPLTRHEAAHRAAPALRQAQRQRQQLRLSASGEFLEPPPGDEQAEREREREREMLEALDAHLLGIMQAVRLHYLIQREGGWDATATWEDVLSLGEQQRLGMARLFFHQPVFGILDECTNATSVDVEEALYRKAQELGITVVTISQRPALIPFHTQELRLIDGEGQWELRSIHSASQSRS